MRHAIIANILYTLVALAPLTALPACQNPRDQALTSVQSQLATRNAARQRSMDLLHKAQQAGEASQPQQARQCLRQAVQEDDRNASAWMALGALEYQQDNYYQAAEAFHRAARLEPTRHEPHFNLGIVLESAGLYPKAAGEYETALKLTPDQLETMEHLARCYIKTHTNLPKAQRLLDQAASREIRPQWVRWIQQQQKAQRGPGSDADGAGGGKGEGHGGDLSTQSSNTTAKQSACEMEKER